LASVLCHLTLQSILASNKPSRSNTATHEEEIKGTVNIDSADPTASPSSVPSSTTITIERIHLLEIEISNYKKYITILERRDLENASYLRNAANKLTEDCMKRAQVEWDLEKTRARLVWYEVSSDQVLVP
jgi:hypothetical protein